MIKLYDKIASGSSGNCIVYFEELMVDAGVAYKKICDVLPAIKYLLYTHKHTDHLNVKTAKRIQENYPDIEIYGNIEVIEKLEAEGINAKEIKADTWLELGEDMTALVRELKHDVLCYGFLVARTVRERVLYLDAVENNTERNVSLLHATDTYDLVGIDAKNLNAYFVEFNHCEKLINENIKNKRSKGVYAYEINARDNHQSNQRIMEWLSHNNVDGLVVPMHISNKNNKPQIISKLLKRIEFLYKGENNDKV